jgi:uncharacterized protein (TIGR00288 family)
MTRVGVFIDVSNIYFTVQQKFPKRKLDYAKLKDFLKDLGDLTILRAYGAQLKDQAHPFIACLKSLGFEPKYKQPKTWREGNLIHRKADWDVGIAIDIITCMERLDIVVLLTGDGDMLPLVEYLKERGIRVVIIAAQGSKDLRDTASTYIEIYEGLLECQT